MKVEDLESCVVTAFEALHIKKLRKIDEDAFYSDLDKEQIIAEISKDIEKIKRLGISDLKVQPTTCQYCYPKANAFSFHHPETEELIIRYVIYQESKKCFIVKECKNQVIPDGENGMPF